MNLDDYLSANYTVATARTYAFEIERYLVYVGGESGALRVKYADVVGYLVSLRGRYENGETVRRILYSVKAYHRYLLKVGKREDHPASRLRLRDVARTDQVQTQDLLDAAELEKLLTTRVERYPLLANRNAVIIGLLVHQALTVSEVGRLQVGDVDLAAATIKVKGSGRQQARTLKLAAVQVMTLLEYLKEDRPRLMRDDIKALILTSRGTAENGEGVHYLVETLRPLVPGKRLTPMVIRQSVIALKLKNGGGLRQVQVFAGHKKVTTTEGYRETNLEELRAAVVRFHPLR
ncbi:tyrosine-type recombinase/integrase [Lewinella sp. 4G2]|uniref:tyrosine-type recombinase/integrase n=1 Tax=Lewinella sp. 4G2 TaxID=1803372 RepID=UPI0007B4ABCD|nr:tyrosine-type recombinase/integrase [Lewinella sp. 4G2]